MTRPLMPKATAVWLIDNTALTFEQIAEFTGIHMLEIQAMADGDVSGSIVGFDPILNGQLTKEEIERCEKDAKASLTLVESDAAKMMRKAGAKYTPMSRRGVGSENSVVKRFFIVLEFPIFTRKFFCCFFRNLNSNTPR